MALNLFGIGCEITLYTLKSSMNRHPWHAMMDHEKQ